MLFSDNQVEDVVPESLTKTFQINITHPEGQDYISVSKNGDFEDKITDCR